MNSSENPYLIYKHGILRNSSVFLFVLSSFGIMYQVSKLFIEKGGDIYQPIPIIIFGVITYLLVGKLLLSFTKKLVLYETYLYYKSDRHSYKVKFSDIAYISYKVVNDEGNKVSPKFVLRNNIDDIIFQIPRDIIDEDDLEEFLDYVKLKNPSLTIRKGDKTPIRDIKSTFEKFEDYNNNKI